MPRTPVAGVADEATRLVKAHPMASVGAIAGGLLVAAAIARRTAPPPPVAADQAPADSRSLTPDSSAVPVSAPLGPASSPLAPAPAAPAFDVSGLASALAGALGQGQQAGVDLGGQGLAAGVGLGQAGLQAGVDLGSAGLAAGTQIGLGGLDVAATSVGVLGSALETSVGAQAYQTVGVTDTLGGVIERFTGVFTGKVPPWWAPKAQPAPKPKPKPAGRTPAVIPARPAGPSQVVKSKTGTMVLLRSAPASGNPRLQPRPLPVKVARRAIAT